MTLKAEHWRLKQRGIPHNFVMSEEKILVEYVVLEEWLFSTVLDRIQVRYCIK
jgi:hypothetical protein